MNKILAALLAVVGCASAVVSIVMLISAVQFMEWGRVIFYLLLAIVCSQIGIWSIVSATKKKK